jgi:hypothetical protein
MLTEMLRAYSLEDWKIKDVAEYVTLTRLLLANEIRKVRKELDPKRLVFLRFEDLIQRPVESIELVMNHLGEKADHGFRQRLMASTARRAGYRRGYDATHVTLPKETAKMWAVLLDDWRSGAVT